MIQPATLRRRRQALHARLPVPVLLVGNAPATRNLRMTEYPFRQDSTFLYYTGCTVPGAAALLVDGTCTLFLPMPEADDALWNGAPDDPEALGAALGVDRVAPIETLDEACARVGVRHALAVPDPGMTALASRITGLDLAFSQRSGPDALVEAVIGQRRTKDDEEVDEIRAAALLTRDAFRLAMAATHAGEHEATIGGLFDGCIAAHGASQSFNSIVTVHGEILHNPHRTHPLREGDLLLLDAGAEVPSGYGADVTRTWPVSGRFTDRQRGAYAAVLEANETCIALCRPGVRFRDIHLAAARVMATFLAEEGILRCSVDTAVETGAHALFFPHGLGHLLGLDAHDLENFGDRAAYAPGRSRSSQFGLCYLRMDLDLEPGLVVTIEPGFYAAPAILRSPSLRDALAGLVDFDRAEAWIGLGGIRIEDDAVVTDGDPDVLTAGIPKSPQALEAVVGSGVPAFARMHP